MASTETRRMVLAASAACEDKKAEDTKILELDPADSGFTDFFLITSGTNERQTQAIADEVELRLKREFGVYPNSVEGRRQGEWVLMDYVDFVVHIFLAERRAYYDIERLRKSAKQVGFAALKETLTEKTRAVRKKVTTTKELTAPKKSAAPKKAATKNVANSDRKKVTKDAAIGGKPKVAKKKQATKVSATKSARKKP
jgi:ribosome-associated protein